MSEFQELVQEVNLLRAKAARFYKADFHLHSPYSHDWMNDSGDPILNRDPTLPITEERVKAYYDVCHKAGLELAAVTDHMRYSFGVQCANYSRKLNTKSRLVFLPGMELSVILDIPTIKDYCIHALAIFPENTSSAIERIFAAAAGKGVPSEDQRKGTERLRFDNVKALVGVIRDNGGLAIAAHIYSNHGARLMFTSKAKFFLEPLEGKEDPVYKEMYARVGDEVKKVLCLFDALQVSAATDPVHFLDSDGTLPVALVLSTDAHKVASLGRRESLTWVKMAEPSFEGLKKAFLFPDTRLRYKTNLPETKPPRLLGLRISGALKNERAFFKNLTLGFSDNLSTIVGPRGSGKSAIIDAIRYVFGYNRTLHEIEKLKDQIIDRQNHTLIETRIEVVYEMRDGGIRILSSTYDPSELYTTKVFDLDGRELHVEDVEKCGDFPLNLYGWSELELLGEQPGSQRENLDKFIHEVKALKDERDRLYEELGRNREDCISRARGLEGFFTETKGKITILRLPEYELAFNRLNTDQMKEKFEALDELALKLEWLKSLEEEIEKFKESVSLLGVPDPKNIQGKDVASALGNWVEECLKNELKWDAFKEKVRQKRNELTAEAQTIYEKIKEKRQLIEEQHREVQRQIASDLGTETAISAELRNNAKARLDKAIAELRRYQAAFTAFEGVLTHRAGLVARLREVNQRIFATRDQHKKTIVDQIMVIQDVKFKIDLLLNQGNDRTLLVEHLTNSPHRIDYSGKQYKSQDWPAVIAGKHTPLSLAEVLLQKQSSALVAEVVREADDGSVRKRTIDAQTSELLVGINCPFQRVEEPVITKVDKEILEKILRLQEVRYDDEFYITLNGKPIQHCSPGQRCSAMLPIVTLTSEAPIVIDQPEDNLDNRLVSRAIFKILSKLKESRQIIVATHNPNIPVSGDAEQVLVMEADGKLKTVGSIDDDGVIQDIIDLLEGGKEAFEKRQKRYRRHLEV